MTVVDMQTFLPYPVFAESAAVLDERRLGKQRVETLQILRALHVDDYGWRNHPAVTMWSGHTAALVCYGTVMVDEWRRRGHGDTTAMQIAEFLPGEPVPGFQELERAGLLPPWLGWEPLHRSHRSALVRKDPDHYGPLFPGVPDDLPYVWPEPPGSDHRLAPPDAWVVRLPDDEVVRTACRDIGVVGMAVPPASAGGRRTRAHRDLDRLIHDLQPGDTVLCPIGEGLLVGEILEDAAGGEVPGLDVLRAVRWHGMVQRGQLSFPAALQAPALVFPLRGEPHLRARATACRLAGH